MIWRFWTLTILLFLSVFGGFAFSLGGFDKRKGLEERGLAFIYATGWAIVLSGCSAAATWSAFH